MTRTRIAEQLLTVANAAVSKHAGLKATSKSVKAPLHFAVDELKRTAKDVPAGLSNAAKTMEHVTGFIGAVEFVIDLVGMIKGDSDGKRPWEKGSSAEAGTGTVAHTAKTLKHALEAFKWGVKISATGNGIVLTMAKMAGPVANGFEIINAIFTCVSQGLKIGESKKMVVKYKNKIATWDAKFQDHTIHKKDKDNDANKVSWDKNSANYSDQKVVDDMKAMAFKKLFGSKAFIGCNVATAEEKKQMYKHRFEDVSTLQADKEKAEKILKKVNEKSLSGKIDAMLDKIGDKKVLTKKFMKAIQDGKIVGINKDMAAAELMAVIKDKLRSYIKSDSRKVTDAVLKNLMERSKYIANVVKGSQKIHERWRKWSHLAKYTMKDENEKGFSVKEKADRLIKYANDKKVDKQAEIKNQKKAQAKSWVTIAFMIAVFFLALASLILAVSPVSFAALPYVMFGLIMSVSLLSLTKFVVGEIMVIKKKHQLERAELPELVLAERA